MVSVGKLTSDGHSINLQVDKTDSKANAQISSDETFHDWCSDTNCLAIIRHSTMIRLCIWSPELDRNLCFRSRELLCALLCLLLEALSVYLWLDAGRQRLDYALYLWVHRSMELSGPGLLSLILRSAPSCSCNRHVSWVSPTVLRMMVCYCSLYPYSRKWSSKIIAQALTPSAFSPAAGQPCASILPLPTVISSTARKPNRSYRRAACGVVASSQAGMCSALHRSRKGIKTALMLPSTRGIRGFLARNDRW